MYFTDGNSKVFYQILSVIIIVIVNQTFLITVIISFPPIFTVTI
jgi:hypothetical protein